jgi:hypothetical protein
MFTRARGGKLGFKRKENWRRFVEKKGKDKVKNRREERLTTSPSTTLPNFPLRYSPFCGADLNWLPELMMSLSTSSRRRVKLCGYE